MLKQFRALGAAIACVAGAEFAAAEVTPVLQTRDKTAQCEAILAWVDVTRDFAGEKAMTGRMTVSGEMTGIAPAFAPDIFPTYFGKAYFDLSKGDKKKIVQALKRCSENNARYWFGTAGVNHAFQTRTDRYDVEGWQAEIRKYPSASELLASQLVENEKAAEQRRIAEVVRTTPNSPMPNRAGELLLDMPNYSIHAFRINSHDFRGACMSASRTFSTSILIKDQSTRLTRAYMNAILRDALLPLARQTCPEASSLISAQVFYKDVHLDKHAARIQPSVVSRDFNLIEVPVMMLSGTPGAAPEQFRLTYFERHNPDAGMISYYETLAGLERLGKQEFQSDENWALIQQMRNRYSSPPKN